VRGRGAPPMVARKDFGARLFWPTSKTERCTKKRRGKPRMRTENARLLLQTFPRLSPDGNQTLAPKWGSGCNIFMKSPEPPCPGLVPPFPVRCTSLPSTIRTRLRTPTSQTHAQRKHARTHAHTQPWIPKMRCAPLIPSHREGPLPPTPNSFTPQISFRPKPPPRDTQIPGVVAWCACTCLPQPVPPTDDRDPFPSSTSLSS